jgi:hypothetical protein
MINAHEDSRRIRRRGKARIGYVTVSMTKFHEILAHTLSDVVLEDGQPTVIRDDGGFPASSSDPA